MSGALLRALNQRHLRVDPNQVESVLTYIQAIRQRTLSTLSTAWAQHVQQTRQGPSSSNFDSVETDYDAVGRTSRVTLPYSELPGKPIPWSPHDHDL